MQRAMAKQAEAEREKRAKVIHAQGELLASTQLAQAAAVIGSQPSALQLRYLQTLTEIAVEKNSTIVFPLPLDLVAPMIQILQRHAGEPVHEPLNGSRTNEPSLTNETEVGGTGLSSKGARNPVDCSSSFTKKGYIYDNLTTDGYAPADDRPIFRESQ